MSQLQEYDPVYDPDTWKLGYQGRQFGVAGNSVALAASVQSGLANPPAGMVVAATVISDEPPAKHVIVDTP